MLSIILNLFVYYSSICVFWLFHPFFTVNPFPPIHNLFLSSLFCSIYLLQRSCHTILSYIICVLILGRVSPPIFFFFFFQKWSWLFVVLWLFISFFLESDYQIHVLFWFLVVIASVLQIKLGEVSVLILLSFLQCLFIKFINVLNIFC